jgi:NhaP-type Na+/H+ or K+/H+ antiporter
MSATALLLIAGFLVILAAWVPLFLRGTVISLPMIAVAIGLLLSLLTGVKNPLIAYGKTAQWVSEFALLVAVLGAGLRIDRPFSLKTWASTWRLLFLVMLLTIAAVALAAFGLLGLSAGYAILLGAVLSPTDPVLAAAVQAGPPGVGEEGEAKFALTSEAGLNDGLAYPFIFLGFAIAQSHFQTASQILDWVFVEFAWNIAGGVIAGFGVGAALVYFNRVLPQGWRLPDSNSGLVSVGLALVAYGVADAIHGNGFVAVFSEAVTIRNLASSFEYSRRLTHTAEQFERIATVVILAFLGAGLLQGLLANTGWAEIGFALLVLVAIRPAAVALGFIGASCDRKRAIGLGVFGIRGIASIYYISYVLNQLDAAAAQTLAHVVSLVIVFSVVRYGVATDRVAKPLLGHRPEESPGAP